MKKNNKPPRKIKSRVKKSAPKSKSSFVPIPDEVQHNMLHVLDQYLADAGIDDLSDDEEFKPKYSLSEFLSQSDLSKPVNADLRDWEQSPPVGREII